MAKYFHNKCTQEESKFFKVVIFVVGKSFGTSIN